MELIGLPEPSDDGNGKGEPKAANGDANGAEEDPGAAGRGKGAGTNRGAPQGAKKKRPRAARKPHIPSKTAILETVNKLNPLIATGMLGTAQANSIRGNFKLMLDELREDSQ